MQKFYDTISLMKLVPFALVAGFPPQILLQCTMLYLGARVIKFDGCFSTAAWPTNSITAGCCFANAMARLILFESMRLMHLQHPRAAPRQYVDDLAQRCEGTREEIMLTL